LKKESFPIALKLMGGSLISVDEGYLLNSYQGIYLLDKDFKLIKQLFKNDVEFQRQLLKHPREERPEKSGNYSSHAYMLYTPPELACELHYNRHSAIRTLSLSSSCSKMMLNFNAMGKDSFFN